jgi:hypothetical protein
LLAVTGVGEEVGEELNGADLVKEAVLKRRRSGACNCTAVIASSIDYVYFVDINM